MTSPFDNAEALLRERQWLRGFARALVQDDSQADDLTQDTLLVALRRQPAQRAGLRPWLARVVRNLAGKRARREATRSTRERAAARAEPLPSTADVVERLQAEQALVRALLALDESYRYVVVLRFWEDLPPRAIAAKLGVPVETVRTRLKRALAQLRGALDRAHGGDRRAWALPLLATPLTTTLVGAGVLMNAKKGAIAAAIAVLAVAGSAPLWWPAAAPAPAVERAAPMVVTVEQTSVAKEAPAEPAVAAQRAAAPPPAARLFAVTGRCIDERGVPLSGCAVRLNGWAAVSQQVASYELHHGRIEWSDPPPQTTGPDGRFAFTFTPPPPYHFNVTLGAPGRVEMRAHLEALPDHGQKDLGDLALPTGCLVHGAVVDAEHGPQPDVEVRLQAEPPAADERRTPAAATAVPSYHARTDAAGAFTFPHALQPGAWTVEVGRRTLLSPPRFEIGDQPEQSLQIEVRPLPDVPAITGVVVDEQGTPVRFASVSWRANGRIGFAASDHQGSFRLRLDDDLPPQAAAPRPAPAPILEATADGFERGCTDEPVAWGTRDVRLVLRRGTQLEVRVHDRDTGEPIEDFGVRLEWSPSRTSRAGAFALTHVGHHPGGVVRIDSVSRVPHLLLVEPRGERWLPSDVVAIDISDRTPPIDVRLSAPQTRTLRIVTADDTPVAGVPVELLEAFEGDPVDQQTYALDLDRLGSVSGGVRRAMLLQRGTTDARGAFELRGPAGRSLAVRLPGPGHVPAVAQPVTLEHDAPPLLVRVALGATVRGTIGPPALVDQLRANDDRPASVFLRPTAGTPGPSIPPRYRESTFWLDSHGGFSVAGIPPGSWELCLTWMEPIRPGSTRYASSPAAILGTLRDGEVRELAIDLRRLLKAYVAGVVLYHGVPPPVGSSIALRAENNDSAASDETAPLPADGRFAFDLRGGSYRVSLLWKGQRWLPLEVPITVAPGERREGLVVNVAGGVLRVRVLGPDSRPRRGVGLALASLDGGWRPEVGTTDDDGMLTYEPAPVGRLLVRVIPKPLPGDDADREPIEVGTVDVRPGAEPTTIEVRLPASAGYD